jgi:magnesium-transporting ATPase (P-type)
MNKLITLLKTKSVQWALVIAILSVLQGFVFELPLTPIHQMIAGVVISVVVVLLKFIETGASA